MLLMLLVMEVLPAGTIIPPVKVVFEAIWRCGQLRRNYPGSGIEYCDCGAVAYAWSTALDIEKERYDVSILDDVIFAF